VAGDRSALIAAYAGGATPDRFELFVVPRLAGINGVTFGPFDGFAASPNNSIEVTPRCRKRRVTAHST